MINIRDKNSGALLGTITEDELQVLIDSFEEESTTDRDYYIQRATIDMLEENQAPPSLVQMLRMALGQREDMDIEWEEG